MYQWLKRQIGGTWGNSKEIRSEAKDAAAGPVRRSMDTLADVKKSIPHAFGAGTPQQQVVSSAFLAVVAFASSLVSAGATLVFVALFGLTGLWGLIRLIPAANDAHNSGRDKLGGGDSWSLRER